jgi:hypothetical protein
MSDDAELIVRSRELAREAFYGRKDEVWTWLADAMTSNRTQSAYDACLQVVRDAVWFGDHPGKPERQRALVNSVEDLCEAYVSDCEDQYREAAYDELADLAVEHGD